MNNENNQKISHIFNLPSLNFKNQMNIAIDSNAHIKTIINVQAYLYDTEIDAVLGKCNIKGKIGVKLLYLDVDNVYNTISDSTSFMESVSSADIVSDCKIFMTNEQVLTDVSFDDKYLKLNFNVNAKLFSNIDLILNLANTNQEGLIQKKSSIEANSCLQTINNKNSQNCEIVLKKPISKILSTSITPCVESIECFDGYITISGNSQIQIIYETTGDNPELKLNNESCKFKFETQASLCETNCLANLELKLDNSKTNFTTELNEENTKLNLEYEINILGCVYKNLTIEYVEDIYSTQNELETNFSNREVCKISPLISYKSNIEGEIQLADDANADEIIETVNHSCLLTQVSCENNKIVLEGVVSTSLIYLNEQKEIKSVLLELPFSIAKEMQIEENCNLLNFNLVPTNCKAKLKRGNLLAVDYEMFAQGYISSKNSTNMLDNIKLGKQFDYGDVAFQIIIAKENEDTWNFCKRCHISSQELTEFNKDLPPIFQGGEKVVIYR